MITSRLAMTVAAALLAACNPSKAKTSVTTGTDGPPSPSAGLGAGAQGEAMVRLLNALPTSPAVAVNSSDSALFANVTYKMVTEYREVGDNTADFKLVTGPRSEGTSPVAENHEVLRDGAYYTAIALPEKDGSGAELKILRDELVPGAGKAQVRVIHAAPGVGAMDVKLAGQKDPLFSRVNDSSEAGFKEIDPVTATVEIRDADSHKRLVALKDLKFEIGRNYTIVITGSPNSKVEAITVNDPLTPGKPIIN